MRKCLLIISVRADENIFLNSDILLEICVHDSYRNALGVPVPSGRRKSELQ
jgi:hypothetical protein